MKKKLLLKSLEKKCKHFGACPSVFRAILWHSPVGQICNNRLRRFKRTGFVLFLLTAFSFGTLAQKITVSGTVTDAKGNALQGASVLLKGSRVGTSTDSAGHYHLATQSNDVLVFNNVGYITQEIPVNGQAHINVQLVSGDNSLNQIVVVSYGTQKRKDITGAISTVDASTVKDIPGAEVGTKLQGKVPGLQIDMANGRPGQGIEFRLRGAASLGSGFQPLIVVDGQPLSGIDTKTGGINLINPDDIESISVLKDASATSLYGSRAANGVVLITTKHAKDGITNVMLSAYNGWQSVPQKGRPQMMNAQEYATYMKEYYEDAATYSGYTGGIPSDYANPDQYGKGTDWYSTILRTAPMQDITLSLSSGTGKLSSSTSMTYFRQQGVLYNTGMTRYSLRSNNEYHVNDKVKIGLNLSPSYQINNNTTGATDGSRQIIGLATIASPLIPVYNSPGDYNYTVSSSGNLHMNNPLQQLKNLYDNQNVFRILANLYGEVDILKNLIFKSSLSSDFGMLDENAFYNSYYGPNVNSATLPRPTTSDQGVNNSYNYISWLNENTLTYNLKSNGHSVEVLAGYSSQKWSRNYRSIVGTGYANDAIPWIPTGTTISSAFTNNEQWSLASLFGRISYSYKDKYLLMANLRQDGSSRFGTDNKYGTFPSASAGWVVSNEKFFPKTVINFLKIRGSYGETGNFNIGNYQSISNLGISNYTFGGTLTSGEAITAPGNTNLTWEKSTQTDLGLDMNFLHDRIMFSYDYYNKITNGMLYPVSLPYSSGYASIEENVGKFKIWGHEFQLNTRNLVGAFTWNTNFNISFNDNRVLELPPNVTFVGGGPTYSGYNRSIVGHHIGEFYGYVFEGVYENQQQLDSEPVNVTSTLGSARMKDVNGDGKIDANDRTLIGNPNPKFIYGMSNTFGYKNFDLAIVVAGQVGNKIMDDALADEHNLDGVWNVTKDMKNRWRSPTDIGDGKTPSTISGGTELYRLANTTFISSGDYLTVKNITLGYTADLHKLKYIKSLRLYASVQQAFVFTKYKGQNPEASVSTDDATNTYGQDLSTYPIPRTIMIGANFNF